MWEREVRVLHVGEREVRVLYVGEREVRVSCGGEGGQGFMWGKKLHICT